MTAATQAAVKLPGPRAVFGTVAVTEAFTWAGLLVGMFLKRVTHTTDVGVQVFGMLHGIVFIAYCLITVLVAINQQWSRGRLVLGLLASIPPFFTVLFEWYVARRGLLDRHWRDHSSSRHRTQRAVWWLLEHSRVAAAFIAVAVAVLTVLALAVGPPAG